MSSLAAVSSQIAIIGVERDLQPEPDPILTRLNVLCALSLSLARADISCV